MATLAHWWTSSFFLKLWFHITLCHFSSLPSLPSLLRWPGRMVPLPVLVPLKADALPLCRKSGLYFSRCLSKTFKSSCSPKLELCFLHTHWTGRCLIWCCVCLRLSLLWALEAFGGCGLGLGAVCGDFAASAAASIEWTVQVDPAGPVSLCLCPPGWTNRNPPLPPQLVHLAQCHLWGWI